MESSLNTFRVMKHNSLEKYKVQSQAKYPENSPWVNYLDDCFDQEQIAREYVEVCILKDDIDSEASWSEVVDA